MKNDTETINKSQKEMDNTISIMKYTVEAIKNRPYEPEDQISNLEDKVKKIIKTPIQNKK